MLCDDLTPQRIRRYTCALAYLLQGEERVVATLWFLFLFLLLGREDFDLFFCL